MKRTELWFIEFCSGVNDFIAFFNIPAKFINRSVNNLFIKVKNMR
jgi:hypothetical protein